MALGLSPLPQPRVFSPGDRLGTYELIRQIAVGGNTELYLARTRGLEGFEKLVCVKRILPPFAKDPSFVAMFVNEARLAATLQHPNIAQVFDIGVDAADYFMSMEYVHGEDLGRLLAASIEQGVPVALDCALTLVVGLCAGLHYAHEKIGPDGTPLHVVHRDVSPSNILVSYEGAVKLVDFGISGRASPGGDGPELGYRSPEQRRGATTLDRRSDIFAVGAILYELTTGRHPFPNGGPTEVVPPSHRVPGYSPILEAIVLTALARDPDQRYRTAQELQSNLERFAHENRLRLSPLVLNRFMSSLFPARLEDWNNAQTQGAFFVEQHVVRTLLESGKTSDSSPAYVEPPTVMGEEAPTRIRGSTSGLMAARTTPLPPPRRASTPPPTAHGSGPKPMPTHQPSRDYVADHTELVRPIKPRWSKPDRPDLAVRATPGMSWKFPVITGAVGLVGLAIALAVVTRGGRSAGEVVPEKSIVDVEEAPLVTTPVTPPAPPPVVTAPPPSTPPPATPTLTVEPPPTVVEPEPPPPPIVAEPEPAATAVPARPKRPAVKKGPITKPEKKPVKADKPETGKPSGDKVDTSKPWSKDSPFMPVRPVKKSR